MINKKKKTMLQLLVYIFLAFVEVKDEETTDLLANMYSRKGDLY